jgi:hypothetical protein
MTDPVEETHGVPVSKERIAVCLASATFWTRELPRYADGRQRWADAWAIAAGILAAATSLSIFPVLGDDSTDAQKWVVSIFAFAAAICALIPRIRNYGELAGSARELASRYGSLEGDLLDLSKADPVDQDRARTIVTDFQATKEKKDALRGLPDRTTVELRRIDGEKKLAAARQGLADAKKADPG